MAVIVNHWPSRRGGQAESSWLREAAADLSRSIADSLYRIDPDIGVIVMGDLNDDPFDKSVSVRRSALRKTWPTQPPSGFYNPFWEKLDRGIGSYIYRGGWNLFDQIVVNRNIVDGTCGLKFLGAEGPQQEIPDTEQRPVCRLSPPYILFRGMDQRILRTTFRRRYSLFRK